MEGRPPTHGVDSHEAEQSKEKYPQEGFFDAQYAFALIVSERKHIPLEDALFTNTSFFNRFGLRSPENTRDASHPEWHRYLQGLADHKDDPMGYTYEFYKQSLSHREPQAEKVRFGCFSFDLRDEGKSIHIHFKNADTDEESPLSDEKLATRKSELKEMFSYVKKTYPEVTTVEGGSWLYNKDRYLRLFPASFGDSRKVFQPSDQIRGLHYWGQLLDHQGRVRLDRVKELLAKAREVDVNNLGSAFPFPVYKTQAPIEDFYRFYRI